MKKEEAGMKIMFKDTEALVVAPQDKEWKVVCVTEYTKEGKWMCGLNLITSIEDILQTAWENKLYIIPEVMLQDNSEKSKQKG